MDQSNYSRKLGTTLDPVTTRSDKQATENREPANEMNKEDPRQGILVWLQPFAVNLEDLEAHVLAHSSERANSDSEGDASKVETQKRKHSVHAYLDESRQVDELLNFGDPTSRPRPPATSGRRPRRAVPR